MTAFNLSSTKFQNAAISKSCELSCDVNIFTQAVVVGVYELRCIFCQMYICCAGFCVLTCRCVTALVGTVKAGAKFC